MEQIFGGGILWTLLIGFLAGLLARALKPGDDKLGFFMTIVLGILGALLARFIGGTLMSAVARHGLMSRPPRRV